MPKVAALLLDTIEKGEDLITGVLIRLHAASFAGECTSFYRTGGIESPGAAAVAAEVQLGEAEESLGVAEAPLGAAGEPLAAAEAPLRAAEASLGGEEAPLGAATDSSSSISDEGREFLSPGPILMTMPAITADVPDPFWALSGGSRGGAP